MASPIPPPDLKLPPILGDLGPKANGVFTTLTAKYRPGPPTLYHYTTAAGLLGILDQRAIRASNMRFLNDSAEFLHSLRLAESVMERLSPRWSATWERVAEGAIRTVLRDVAGVGIYVFSLSEHKDRLSQWRAYGQGGAAFAVGFDIPSLFTLIQRRKYLIGPCLYQRDDQERLVSAICEDVHDAFEKWIDDTDGAPSPAVQSHFASMFYVQFMGVASLLKDPSFEEEGEWRVISEPVWGPDPQAKFRAGRTTLIPYRLFDLAEDGLGKISELVVGPSAQRDLAMTAARQLAASARLPIAQVTPSVVPFREV